MTVSRRALMIGATALLGSSVLPMQTASATTAEELIALIHELPPMRRLFVVQRLYDKFTGEEDIFDGSYTQDEFEEIYDEWLAGFSPCVIEAFETGRMKVLL
ncbi:hypothetical protein [Neoaquamicrobium sediminum]|uniref:hypothetical protein n=1 Tax=Neoaquamicrobium sediminum TaxID=1849104 RepID=UPI001564DC56|nr:hypothetical protein [Mesorhizobium sediminum]NRC52989.1 hypothetical protein [Mesorhizobium sediminum]